MKKNNSKKPSGLSRRVHFPDDEKRLPWLPPLLDSYAIADTGVALALRHEEKRSGKKAACVKGCDACCHQPDIPLYPHELVGIYWYAAEKIEPGVLAGVARQLAAVSPGACPFLVDRACAIHPVRPTACRQFVVFSKACIPAEDPYYSRRDDVLVPIAEYTDRAFARVFPFYAIKSQADPSNGIASIRRQIVNLRSFDWTKLLSLLSTRASRS